MNKVYCKECGAATEYGYKRPNFCSSCGTSFASSNVLVSLPQNQNNNSKQTPQRQSTPQAKIIIAPQENSKEENNTPSYANLTELKVSIDIPEENIQKVKLGSIIGTEKKRSKNKNLPKRPGVDIKKWVDSNLNFSKRKRAESKSLDIDTQDE
jgi:ABC-type lipoprotein release transport system permease subunit